MSRQLRSRWILALALLAVGTAGCGLPASLPDADEAEVLWDTWGVPHIYAGSGEAASYAFGWAQMSGHPNLLLELYGIARGQAAEYWGERYYNEDVYLHRLGLPERAARLYEAQDPASRARLDAFVRGLNEYVETHPEAVAERFRQVLPLTPEDVLAHLQRAIHLTFVARQARFATRNWRPGTTDAGSNAWAIAPRKSASGNAMLLANPHLSWSGLYYFYEAQMTVPEFSAYGVALIGTPMLAIAFNEDLGWTHTVNTYDGVDLYELESQGDGYRWGGEVRPFETRQVVLKVRQDDGTFQERRLTIRSSVHGPVLSERNGKALAVRIAGLEKERSRLGEQYWAMTSASTLQAFEQALAKLQMPMFNVVYADRHGNIFYAFNALQPVRSRGDVTFWNGVVDGSDPDLLWTEYRSYQELPKYRNPESGFVQNANDPPWTSTFPQVLKPSDFPPDTAPERMPFRPQNSARLLMADDEISFEEAEQYRKSTRLVMADAVLDDLITAARHTGRRVLRQAADVLESWDRQTLADSRGAVLFQAWTDEVGMGILGQQLFAEPWNPAEPLETPRGIADDFKDQAVEALEAAVNRVQQQYGRIDVAWGEAVRVRYAGRDLGASVGPGALGAFRVGFLRRQEDGTQTVVGGNTFVALVEFGDKIRAKAILAYGNTTRDDSPHFGDQLELFSRGQMRQVWFYRPEVEANLAGREAFRLSER